jgi:hypothetical protein
MAKKASQKIYVKKPILGESYYFRFAGGIMRGTFDGINEKLTDYYNHKWYWIKCSNDSRDIRYPVSMYNISTQYNDLKSKS